MGLVVQKNIAIVGAGVAGITTAYFLAKKGHRIHIYDKHETVAQECSYANGGQISVCNAEVWNTWDNIFRGMAWMFNKQAPLNIRFDKWDWKKVKWLASFIGTTLINSYDRNTRKTIDYCLRSRDLLLELEDETKIKFDQNKCGIAHIYRNKASYEHALVTANRFHDTGWNVKIHPVNDLKNIVTTSIIGATYAEDDFVGDIHLFCKRLFKYLQKHYEVNRYTTGVIGRDTYPCDGVTLQDLEKKYDRVIVAAGADTPQIVKAPIYPVKGYSITIPIRNKNAPVFSIIDDDLKIVTSTYTKRFRVAGTAELAGYDKKTIPENRIEPLLKWTNDMTYIDTKNYKPWACLRPMTPNMLPIIKKVNNKTWINSGAGHLGWTMAMSLAEQVSKEVN